MTRTSLLFAISPSITHNQCSTSSRSLFDLLQIFVSAICAAKIEGLSVYDLLDRSSFGKVGFAKRVFYHDVIHRCHFITPFRLAWRWTGKEQRLQYPVTQVDQKAKEQESHSNKMTFLLSSKLDSRDRMVFPSTG
jgi:hypothetical protein